MAWFRCLICGENFPGELIGEAGEVGFYVTRFVEAEDAEAAESAVLGALRTEAALTPPAGAGRTAEARVYFKEVEEVTAESVPATQPGFAWYPMDSDE